MSRPALFVATIILVCPSPSALAATPISYAAFTDMVARQHPETAVDEKRVAEAEEATQRAGLLSDPELTAGRTDPDAAWEIGLSQRFPWPGTLAAKERASKAQSAAVATDVNLAAEERRFAAAELFIRMVRVAKLIDAQRASLAVVEGVRDFTHAKFKQGIGSHMEFLQSHSEGGILKANLAALETDLRNLKRHAILLLNDPVIKNPDELELLLEWPKATEESKPSQDFVRERLLRDKEVVQARSDAAYRSTLPAFTASGMMMKERESGMPMYGAMAGISIPLYSTAERRSLTRDASNREARIGGELAWHERQQDLALSQTRDRIAQIEANAKALSQEIIPPVKEHIEAATAQFGQGKAEISAIIEGRRSLLNLQITEVRTAEALALARLSLERILAGLVEPELDVEVPQLPGSTGAGMSMDAATSGMTGTAMPGRLRPMIKTNPRKAAPESSDQESRGGGSGMGM